ncbi:MAG: AroM family protein [Natronomonas sp.]|uniref:AroM family protein n=1 Tax=Natronomonas sp. TaxID=2184060 RepID=UPI002870650D|nr:AroM family protein [Natronomonas sp.]MDR9382186.1 AroM family protein [Natronomonas sp.]MDR9432015.1 AroM family protein [Natronomonas sp.]
MTTLGFVTIGQAPRTDITPDIVDMLPEWVDVVEAGALDGFDSADAVRDAVGPREDEPVFVTRLRDSSTVTVDRASVIDHVQARIDELAESVSTICILCTGDFPAFDADVPILEPSDLLHAWTTSIVPGGRIGVLMPKEEQLNQTIEKWAEFDVVAAAGSPYTEEDEVGPAAETIGTEIELVVMDCMGYTPAMKATVREKTGAGVLLGRSVLGKTATEVL